ncbi:MAG: RNA polymerase sigma factor [Bryobacteraceae bacterium]
MRRLARGDEDAFRALYHRRQAAIYRFALQMCGSAEIAEDVTQEVFLTVIRDARSFHPEKGAVVSWLFGMARNRVLQALDRDRRYLPLDEEDEDTGAAADNPLDDLTRGESLESLRQAVLALPSRYREVVVLCDLEELSYEDAARALDCAVGTVRSRLHRGRELIARKLRTAARDLPRMRCAP